ncbi:hypothetical protein M9H77_06392 [Catharanthus roseus]|uniref:Uncharacterized protein n=1 Tax=Catharanthus roseus TaxID=4058 RepID=A0ACC0BRZ0_CATRO|nr:hypothetical protein M9H77_06392 [Catharanthus roseus]
MAAKKSTTSSSKSKQARVEESTPDPTTPNIHPFPDTVEDFDPIGTYIDSHHALRWVACLVESQEGLETKVGLRADLVGAQGICSLVWPVIWRVRLTHDEQRCTRSRDLVRHKVQDVFRIDFYHPYFNDTKEPHVLCKIHNFNCCCLNRKSSPVLSSVFDIYCVSITPHCQSVKVKMGVSLLGWS